MGGSRVPAADSSNNRLDHEVIGNKSDAAVTTVGVVASIVAYLKGLLNRTALQESQGVADIDVSAAVYTGYIELLKIEPAAGGCRNLSIALDWNKATTGFGAQHTSQTIDAIVEVKTDGTNWRLAQAFTQVSGTNAAAAGTNGQRVFVGTLGPGADARVCVKLSAEVADTEIPYCVTYEGAAATITAVAAG